MSENISEKQVENNAHQQQNLINGQPSQLEASLLSILSDDVVVCSDEVSKHHETLRKRIFLALKKSMSSEATGDSLQNASEQRTKHDKCACDEPSTATTKASSSREELTRKNMKKKMATRTESFDSHGVAGDPDCEDDDEMPTVCQTTGAAAPRGRPSWMKRSFAQQDEECARHILDLVDDSWHSTHSFEPSREANDELLFDKNSTGKHESKRSRNRSDTLTSFNEISGEMLVTSSKKSQSKHSCERAATVSLATQTPEQQLALLEREILHGSKKSTFEVSDGLRTAGVSGSHRSNNSPSRISDVVHQPGGNDEDNILSEKSAIEPPDWTTATSVPGAHRIGGRLSINGVASRQRNYGEDDILSEKSDTIQTRSNAFEEYHQMVQTDPVQEREISIGSAPLDVLVPETLFERASTSGLTLAAEVVDEADIVIAEKFTPTRCKKHILLAIFASSIVIAIVVGVSIGPTAKGPNITEDPCAVIPQLDVFKQCSCSNQIYHWTNEITEALSEVTTTLASANITVNSSLPEDCHAEAVSLYWLSSILLSNEKNGSPSLDISQRYAISTSLLKMLGVHRFESNELLLNATSCGQNGIICNSDGEISGLEFGGRDLRGEMPTELILLTKLSLLGIQNNHLTGEIPNLLSLTNLKRFSAEENQLSGRLLPERLPPSIGILRLNSNQFYGNIPDITQYLPELRRLQLHDNRFTGTLPDIANGTRLLVLNLGHNFLDGTLNTQYSNAFRDLAELVLSNNSFTGGFPSCYVNITTLNILQIDGNRFNESVPEKYCEHISGLTVTTDCGPDFLRPCSCCSCSTIDNSGGVRVLRKA